MIDWSTVTEVIDGLLWIVGGVVLLAVLLMPSKDAGDF